MAHVNANGCDLWYSVSGKGEPVVVTGGFAIVHNQYQFVTPYLEKTHTVVNWDMRNTGLSGKSPLDYRDYSMHAKDLKAILDAAGIEKTHLWGTSSGSLISLRFALDYPQRTGALIIYPFYKGTHLKEGFNPTIELAESYGMEPASRFFSWVGYYSPANREKWERWEVETIDRNISVETLRIHCDALFRVDLTERLPELKAPLLILSGDTCLLGMNEKNEDWLTIKRMVPKAELALVKGVGGTYCVHEKPEETTQLAVAFLKKHPLEN